MKETTIEAKTVAQAIEQGLKQLGLRRDQVEVTVTQEPTAGILGFGAKPAKITLRPKAELPQRGGPIVEDDAHAPRFDRAPRREKGGRGGDRNRGGSNGPRGDRGGRGGRERRDGRDSRESRPVIDMPPPPAPGTYVPDVPKTQNKESDEVKRVLGELLGLLQFGECEILAGWDDKQGRVRVELVSANARQLIGRDAAVLEALQFMATLVANRRLKTQIAVQVDVDGHWKRIEERAVASALRAADDVKRNGKAIRLEPMDAPLRRLIHKTYEENPEVETVSEGEGPYRKVVIKPRRK